VPLKKRKVQLTTSTVAKIGDAATDYWTLRKSLLEKEHELKVAYLQEKRMWTEKYFTQKIENNQQKHDATMRTATFCHTPAWPYYPPTQ
jgi:hypothetical protein